MSIAPAEQVEISLDELADLEFEPADLCMWRPAPCDEHAAWKLAYSCCGIYALLCQEHAAQKRAELAWLLIQATASGRAIVCKNCHVRSTPSPDLFTFTQIPKEG